MNSFDEFCRGRRFNTFDNLLGEGFPKDSKYSHPLPVGICKEQRMLYSYLLSANAHVSQGLNILFSTVDPLKWVQFWRKFLFWGKLHDFDSHWSIIPDFREAVGCAEQAIIITLWRKRVERVKIWGGLSTLPTLQYLALYSPQKRRLRRMPQRKL